MARLPDTIEIKFKGNSKELTDAIKSLDRATKSLINSQAKLVDKERKGSSTKEKHKKQVETLIISVRALGGQWSKNATLLSLHKKALKGDKVAMQQLRIATRKYIATLGMAKKGMLETAHSTRILGGSFAVLRSKLLIASFAVSIVGMTVGKLVKLFGEQEKAERKLSSTIGRRSDILLAFASAQQQVTTFGDEEIITAMSLVGAYTENEKAIAQLTKASMDLSVAKGMDLRGAVDLVSKSVFSSTNALSRYGISIEGVQGSTERLESATKAISDLYGGQAKADATTMLGAMKQLGNAVGDVGENLGSVFVPIVLLSARGMQAFAETFDEEKIKSYALTLGVVAVGYTIYAKGAVIATKAMALFNKMSKKNLIVLAGMVVVAELIDKFNLFADGAGDLTAELEALEGAIGNVNSKSEESTKIIEAEIALLQQKVHLQHNGLNLEEQLLLVNLEMEKNRVLKVDGLITEEEQIKRNLALTVSQIKLTEQLKEARIKSVGSFAGALSQLNKSMKGSAILSKRLAQTQAIIDTYAGANRALGAGVPPWNYIAMATVIATGLANVATIEAQKFAKGGDFVTDKPELIMVGEAGREHVQITPVDRPEDRALGGGVTVNIMGGIVQEDYVTNELLPAINKARALA
jgi:uncharacterized protein YunC (DUF1805 family)